MSAKINADKVGRILGSTDTADFLVKGSRVTDLDTVIWMKEFHDYGLSHHKELTATTGIVTCVLQYNNGTIPETQVVLDAVLEKIPDDTKKAYFSGSMNVIIQFNTKDLTMGQKNRLKEQMIKDITFIRPPKGLVCIP